MVKNIQINLAIWNGSKRYNPKVKGTVEYVLNGFHDSGSIDFPLLKIRVSMKEESSDIKANNIKDSITF